MLAVSHGVFCVGCCWALMLLMFIVGTGSVGWMLALGAVMALEKNAMGPAWLARHLGDVVGIALLATRALEISATAVKVEIDGNIEEIPADTVILAAGAEPFNPLSEVVRQKGIPCEVVGDAGQVAMAFDAVHRGYKAGRDI